MLGVHLKRLYLLEYDYWTGTFRLFVYEGLVAFSACSFSAFCRLDGFWPRFASLNQLSLLFSSWGSHNVCGNISSLRYRKLVFYHTICLIILLSACRGRESVWAFEFSNCWNDRTMWFFITLRTYVLAQWPAVSNPN